jgi:hypothetical protein
LLFGKQVLLHIVLYNHDKDSIFACILHVTLNVQIRSSSIVFVTTYIIQIQVQRTHVSNDL